MKFFRIFLLVLLHRTTCRSICSTDLLCLAIESSACREFQLIIDPPPCPRSSLGPSKFETVKERLVLALLS
ncbi:hypothetical protein PGTUg99_028847 [Puccinia graminis f. sp. tritici]|uniref:Secreted protein n=1 Tax=Puccinia graminis f. sp. tritici TaxID=56615 RepID=A0A5B0NX74_PUCGR|nr:hypothetical protein PGTUg99_028847 [Puccinia graminis f. sp. tritici]